MRWGNDHQRIPVQSSHELLLWLIPQLDKCRARGDSCNLSAPRSFVEIVSSLQIHPQLRRSPQHPPEIERRVGRNVARSLVQFVQARASSPASGLRRIVSSCLGPRILRVTFRLDERDSSEVSLQFSSMSLQFSGNRKSAHHERYHLSIEIPRAMIVERMGTEADGTDAR